MNHLAGEREQPDASDPVGVQRIAAGRVTVFGEDAYPDVWTKAAALLQSIVKNHALVDGNKRLGWMATAVFLEINGVRVTGASNDDVYDLVVAVAAGNLGVDEIAAGLRRVSPRGSRRGRRGGGPGG